ncbi:mRNA decay activator protein ZFP36L1 [Strongylocentrotus purpuratus]|uniref:C3H1-type domain-containing protein n=1 Tax=Strongylocentrotus purpuratus TaxID=7668 RepID=A0A7M7RC40_STRPU|nr:mRNA decay activator protein ZFP36L1 [Strongylocentrotus purpuratus]|eukprot:XP_782811.1 PREDICTED: zinc finger protein 36, C3H1 type-like 1 [Strongylocentrotus purpuratus]
MSTAMVSAFYDVGDMLFSHKNVSSLIHAKTQLRGDTRAVGTPINGSNGAHLLRRHSTSTTGSTSPISTNHLNGNSLFTQQMQMEAVYNKENLNNKPRDRALSESDRNNQTRNQNSSRYKTELCRPYEENGTCKYGDKCQFAHGIHELRVLSRHPKYKTELCRTFHTVGFCPYGPRCHFIHNPDERKLSSPGPCSKSPRDRTIERPRLLHFPSAPLGSTGGDLTPPPMSMCDSPLPLTPPPAIDLLSQDELLATLTNNAMTLSQMHHDVHGGPPFSPSALSPTTLQHAFSAAPSSPFIPLQQINDDLEQFAALRLASRQGNNSVFFPLDEPVVTNNYRPPSPPESLSDPESLADTTMTSTSPTASPVGARLGRLPIFRGISQEDQRY